MIKDNIILGTEAEDNNSSLDQMEIALAIRNSTYNGELLCSLLENEVIDDCTVCSLKSICEGLDTVTQNYLAGTTKVVSSFSFQ